MATTRYGVNNAETVKLWSRKLYHEALKNCWMYKFIGKGSDNILQLHGDTQKGPGDNITVILRMLLSGQGVQGDGTLEGNEEALTTYTDSVTIDQLRHAVRSSGKMSEQRIPFSVREEARMGLADWWSDRFDTWAFNQLCGYTAQADTRYTGNQATTAPDANHHVFPSTATPANTEDDVISNTTSAVMSLTLIDKCVERAKTISPMIRPLMVGGEGKYVMFLHPYQVYDLRTNSNTGQWLDIQKSALSGGKGEKSPIYTGALGEYNGVVLHESTRVTTGATLTTQLTAARRAVFCGAQAAHLAFGQGHQPNKWSWYEELFDYGNQLGVEAGCIGGLKKARFNGSDFATIVASTYAVAH